jgi:solute carrier family 25 uncoupling protein 8/9
MSLYNGIVPGLQRQCLFASLRVGFYDNVKDFYHDKLPASASSNYAALMGVRIASGITTGALAITVAQPTDVVKVRMQAMAGGKTSGQVRYKNSIHAYKTIFRTEGLRGLWRGLGPNVARNSVVNAAELVCYDTIKDLLISYKLMTDNLICHFTSAFSAGFVATLVASPIDVVKTRIMNSSPGQYNGMIDCAGKVIQESGLKGFYKGFTPSFMRMGTWNVLMFVSYEQLKKLALQYKENQVTVKCAEMEKVPKKSTNPFGQKLDTSILPIL